MELLTEKQKKIYETIQRKKQHAIYFDECIETYTCPECGKDLTYDRISRRYTCEDKINCKFVYMR